jgi:nucleoside-diphosphate-sugar epimerase
MSAKSILVTGCAGFIGSHLTLRLLEQGHYVYGIDNFDNLVYETKIKSENCKRLFNYDNFKFKRQNVLKLDVTTFSGSNIDLVINLAALPGQILSWDNFELYVQNNLLSTEKIINFMKMNKVPRIIQASTSSVYGNINNGDENFTTSPISPYGITKLASEHLIKSFSHINQFSYQILRFFSVYGPNQRKDMAFAKFIRAISRNEEIYLTGDGNQIRDFTYVDDVSNIILKMVDLNLNNETFNICSNSPIKLIESLNLIETLMNTKAKIHFREHVKGDQLITFGNNSKIKEALAYNQFTNLTKGLENQIEYANKFVT